MAHTDELTASQVRHYDEYKHAKLVLEEPLTFADLDHEAQARIVDEYRAAKVHEEESS